MSLTKYPIPPQLQAELEALNKEVKTVLAKRKQWMDDHMEECSTLKVGEEIYDLDSGRCLGVITELYRYWQDGDPRFDNQMSIEAHFQTNVGKAGPRSIDNTSRHAGGKSFGSREEAQRRMESRAEYLRWEAAGGNWSDVFK